MILGIDASSYLSVIENGKKFYDGGREVDPMELLRANGVDYQRIRVWNDPKSPEGLPYEAGNCDIDHYVRLAKLVKAKGYKLLLDFHYSDFWADPNKQPTPKAWVNYSADELEQAVYEYTKACLQQAVDNEVAPQLIQVGNEITNGMLWPVGKLMNPDGSRSSYDTFCRFVAAGCRACREICPEAKIILHLERSWDQQVYQEFFHEMAAHGIDYDIIGASYYPYWHGTPDALFANLDACRIFGKERMVMELAYGFTTEPYLQGGKPQRLVIDEKMAAVPGVAEHYPLTPEGQAKFISDFLARAEKEGIDGVFYWEPLWLPGEGISWASEAGQAYIHEEGKTTTNEWANQCLFDYQGEKLPAFDCFRATK
ncbi:MAG: glycosyl hydrolase 53 family protein [Oscillospiraceae bacterium]|nr:glycosyl hydrolase 53 family protein [Oscillospiraceae bacterium]